MIDPTEHRAVHHTATVAALENVARIAPMAHPRGLDRDGPSYGFSNV